MTVSTRFLALPSSDAFYRTDIHWAMYEDSMAAEPKSITVAAAIRLVTEQQVWYPVEEGIWGSK